jgi:HAD superfamily hydrolase (TIGR01490 family)
MGNNNGIVIFDVDDTLIRGQSQQLFIKYLLKKGFISYFAYIKIMAWFVLYKFGFVSDPKKIAEYSFKLFKGKSKEEIEKLSKDFFQEILSKEFYKEALDIIKEHRNKGHKIILLSNAIEIIVRKISERLNIPDYICTKLETVNEIYTGKIFGEVTYGQNKVGKIKNYLSENNIKLEETESWGYGDHSSDIFVLELVKYPFAINPDRKLRKVASERNWGILKFKK